MGTRTIHRCGGCGHSHLEHEEHSGTRCSFGYCACTIAQQAVIGDGSTSEEIPTWPGFNHATGKWASR